MKTFLNGVKQLYSFSIELICSENVSKQLKIVEGKWDILMINNVGDACLSNPSSMLAITDR